MRYAEAGSVRRTEPARPLSLSVRRLAVAVNLTEQQKRLLAFLRQYHAERGIMPTFREMYGAMGLNSKSGIHRILTGLEERHLIRRTPSRARAIELIAEPSQYSKGYVDGLQRGLAIVQCYGNPGQRIATEISQHLSAHTQPSVAA